MLDLKPDLLEKTFNNYSKFDVASHNDADGISSVLSFIRTIPKSSEYNLFAINNSNRTFEQSQLERMLLSKDSALFILDLGSSSKDQLNMLSDSYGAVINIDHHVPIEFKHPNFHLINPHTMGISDPDKYSAGYICHLLNPEKSWLGLVSLLGDNVEYHERYSSFISQFNPLELSSAKNLTYILNSVFAEKLGFVDVNESDNDFSRFILSTKSLVEKSFSSKQYLDLFVERHPDLIDRFNSLVYDIETNTKLVLSSLYSDKLNVFEVKSDYYHIAQQVQKLVDESKPVGTLLIYQVDEERDKIRVMISSTDSEINCRELINNCPYINGGGHINAAGSWGDLNNKSETLNYFRNQFS